MSLRRGFKCGGNFAANLGVSMRGVDMATEGAKGLVARRSWAAGDTIGVAPFSACMSSFWRPTRYGSLFHHSEETAKSVMLRVEPPALLAEDDQMERNEDESMPLSSVDSERTLEFPRFEVTVAAVLAATQYNQLVAAFSKTESGGVLAPWCTAVDGWVAQLPKGQPDGAPPIHPDDQPAFFGATMCSELVADSLAESLVNSPLLVGAPDVEPQLQQMLPGICCWALNTARSRMHFVPSSGGRVYLPVVVPGFDAIATDDDVLQHNCRVEVDPVARTVSLKAIKNIHPGRELKTEYCIPAAAQWKGKQLLPPAHHGMECLESTHAWYYGV